MKQSRMVKNGVGHLAMTLALLFLVSCASSETYEFAEGFDTGSEMSEETASQDQDLQVEGEEFASSDEADGEEDFIEEENEELAFLDEDEAQEPEAQDELVATAAPTETTPGDLYVSQASEVPAEVVEDQAQNTTEPGIGQMAAFEPETPSFMEGDVQEVPLTDAEMIALGLEPLAPALETQAVDTQTALSGDEKSSPKVASASPAKKQAPPSLTPQVRKEGFSQQNEQVNRYYFVRKGDTAESVASLIYGSAEKAQTLKKINPHWSVGSIVYYQSPGNPMDSQMLSYYQANQVQLEGHKVAKGEWLSTIGEKHLGHVKAWRELASVNTLENPDLIVEGQILSLTPQNLEQAPKADRGPAQLAALGSQEQVPVAKTVTEEAPTSPNEALTLAAATSLAGQELKEDKNIKVYRSPVNKKADAYAKAQLEKKRTVQTASAEIGSFFKRHLIFLIIAASIAVIGVVVYAIRQGDKF